MTTCDNEEDRLAFLPRIVWTRGELHGVMKGMDVRPDMGERAWLRKGYDFGVTGVGVVGGAGGSGEGDSGLATRRCS